MKDNFFTKMSRLGLALTFDDVRLRTGYAQVEPQDVSVESKFSRNVPLKIPIVSAAMDTVTGAKMAIALARLGGLGVLHRSMEPREQAREAARVKYHLNGLIDKPVCVKADDTVGDVLAMREDKNYTFWSFPVVDAHQRLLGLLTKNDFDLSDKPELPVRQIMSTDLVTIGPDLHPSEVYKIMQKHKKKVIPVVDSDRCVLGLYVYSDLKRLRTASSSIHNIDKNGQLRVGAAVGTDAGALDRVQELNRRKVDVIVVDTAHGDSKAVIETVSAIKTMFPSLDVVAGNVSEAGAVRRLIEAGADGIKVGQGPGSICTTRTVAGIGTPQVTAIYCCAIAAEGSNVPICADGGLRFSGDITIALGAGAQSVMLGSMLAGTDEAPGRTTLIDGRQWKIHRGMGSLEAMLESPNARQRYHERATGKHEIVAEGIERLVPYKGKLADVVTQCVGGLKRGMGYVGAANIAELRDKADFIRVTRAGWAESHPHDIRLTKGSGNNHQ